LTSFTIAAPGAPRPRTRKRKIPLTPVEKTRTGAKTLDGEWGMEHFEDDGTTWNVVHLPTKTVVADFLGSLTQCRRYTGSGEAADDLKRIQAHDGEHGSALDKECPRCQDEAAMPGRKAS
jgi:hypothetical protein